MALSQCENRSDGSKATNYISGFHVLPRLDLAYKAIKTFRNLKNRVICRVEIDETAGIWPKAHARNEVFLACKMRISKSDWNKRIFTEYVWPTYDPNAIYTYEIPDLDD